MRKKILLPLLLTFGLLTEAQTCPVSLTLKARMIQADLGKACGELKLASVLELEIVEFSDYGYKEKNIAVIIRCPETYNEAYGSNYFVTNQLYEIMVEKQIADSKSDFEYEVQNAEVLKNYPAVRYWVLPGNILKVE